MRCPAKYMCTLVLVVAYGLKNGRKNWGIKQSKESHSNWNLRSFEQIQVWIWNPKQFVPWKMSSAVANYFFNAKHFFVDTISQIIGQKAERRFLSFLPFSRPLKPNEAFRPSFYSIIVRRNFHFQDFFFKWTCSLTFTVTSDTFFWSGRLI